MPPDPLLVGCIREVLDDERDVIEKRRAERMIMQGRAMDGWLHVDVDAGDDDLADWVRRGAAYATSLPPK